ncbi:MAG TPA: HWE histidine kinase domain-containing protein [Rhizomicrobium sp.]|nr:HWE histidine kinase domain-containing protein [Rhizomicrobium sp.]
MDTPLERKDRVNILLVDDQPGKLLSYEVMLAELDENLVAVSSAKEALAYLLKSEVAVILVDVCMPELDGFELAEMIREHPRFQKTAIIFISAVHFTQSDYLRGYAAGAVDYLSVPLVPELLRAKVRVFAELFRKSRDLQKLNDELERRVVERTEALALSADRLRQSEQGRGLALAAGNMGSWDFNLVTGGWFWDEGQSHIFGVDHASFVPTSENVKKGLHPDDIENIRGLIGTLSPDNTTCELEFRIVRATGEVRWCTAVTVASFDGDGVPVQFSGVTTDITERKEAETRQALLAREVDHRAKNTLAVVQAIVRMAKRDSIEDYVRAIEGRIGALAQTHELLSQSRWEGADVRRLVQEELAPYHSENPNRVTIIGPALVLAPEQAQLVAMAVHELATNAAKYGSLSVQTGRVDISLSTVDGTLFLNWTESGGPNVVPPARLGFGTKIISSLGGGRRGRTHFAWLPAGLRFTLELRQQDSPHRPDAAPRDVQMPSSNGDSRLLLVEDELVVGLFMQDLLKTIGYRPTEPIARLSEAIDAATQERFEGAILDMNLNGEIVYPLAELLTRQQVPFLFVTGYAPRSLDPRFTRVPILQKPVVQDELAGALNRVLGRASRAKAAVQPAVPT